MKRKTQTYDYIPKWNIHLCIAKTVECILKVEIINDIYIYLQFGGLNQTKIEYFAMTKEVRQILAVNLIEFLTFRIFLNKIVFNAIVDHEFWVTSDWQCWTMTGERMKNRKTRDWIMFKHNCFGHPMPLYIHTHTFRNVLIVLTFYSNFNGALF